MPSPLASVDALTTLLQTKGLDHEAAYLAHLKALGKNVVEIPTTGSLSERAALTRHAMADGADVVFQAVLYQHPWRGYADFLVKTDAGTYEVPVHVHVAV